MAIVYRRKDKIKVKVGDIEIKISPLGHHDKNKIQSLLVSGNVDSLMEGATLALRCGLKDVKGLKLSDGSDYELEFEDNVLSDDSLDDMMNLECQGKLISICLGLIDGIPNEFKDNNGNALDGVKIIRSESPEKKD